MDHPVGVECQKVDAVSKDTLCKEIEAGRYLLFDGQTMKVMCVRRSDEMRCMKQGFFKSSLMAMASIQDPF
jgi:hypothetical protein